MKIAILRNWYFYFIIVLNVLTVILRFFITKAYSNNLVIECMCMVMLIYLSIFAFIDKEKSLVSERILLIAFLTWVVMLGGYFVVSRQEGLALLLFSLGGAFIAGLIFMVCYLLSKGQLGGGDVKLSVVMGLFLTIERILPVIIYGTLACSIFSIVLLIMKKLTLKSMIPLIPFLHFGLCITLMMM